MVCAQGALRLIDIEAVDINACGGTHVASLAELQVCPVAAAPN